MKVLLLQLDGKLPNIALMRLAAHHRGMGDSVELRRTPTAEKVERGFWDDFDRVYASAIFERTRLVAERLLKVRPDAIVGGTGFDEMLTLEKIGVTTKAQDYSDYPNWRQSIGFSQRGCRFDCWFCKVRRTEGKVRKEQTVWSIWRGEPWPRELILLDNDFFGWEGWRDEIEAIKEHRFKVSFNQGINARCLTDEAAAAIASVDYRDDGMKVKRIYTAWDDIGDESKLMRGLEALARHGVRPDHIMVYMLIGGKDCPEDREHRRRQLREFGARPYPMPYVRTPELVGFQRWVVGAYDKRIPWSRWTRAGYSPRRLGQDDTPLFGGDTP